jgi:hypothetical protein
MSWNVPPLICKKIIETDSEILWNIFEIDHECCVPVIPFPCWVNMQMSNLTGLLHNCITDTLGVISASNLSGHGKF